MADKYSLLNQSSNVIKQGDSENPTSKKAKKESSKLEITQDVVTIPEPREPKKRPPKPDIKAPIRGNSWIHELSSTDNKKEYIAAHQSSDNYCKMVRFQVKKSGDFCRYKTLDAGYFPSEKGQGKSLCTNEINVLDSWSQKNDQTLAFSDSDGGYGIQELKYNKFCD